MYGNELIYYTDNYRMFIHMFYAYYVVILGEDEIYITFYYNTYEVCISSYKQRRQQCNGF